MPLAPVGLNGPHYVAGGGKQAVEASPTHSNRCSGMHWPNGFDRRRAGLVEELMQIKLGNNSYHCYANAVVM